MENRNFRLNMDCLEDRSLPSATIPLTPQLVIDVYVHQGVVTGELQGVQQHLKEAKTASSTLFLASHLRQDADASQSDVTVLTEYLSALQQKIAATPNDPTLLAHAALMQQAEVQSTINAAYAEFFALAYGAPKRVPPTPTTPVDNGPNFGNNGNLPFSPTDPSWVTIANGVRTWDVTPGSGTTLANGTQFHANYTGYLTDGTVFDSSAKSGVLSGTVGTGLINGFSAGLVGMKVGGTRRIDIPGSQAYGANPPAGSGIPANAELVFEVTLLSSP